LAGEAKHSEETSTGATLYTTNPTRIRRVLVYGGHFFPPTHCVGGTTELAHFYAEGSRFESRLGHRRSWLRFFRDFSESTRKVPGL
jgi:hypothetical protein